MVVVIYVYVDTVFGFMGHFCYCFVGWFSMIVWTPAVFSVLYTCVLYFFGFCFCTCSAQLSAVEKNTHYYYYYCCCCCCY